MSISKYPAFKVCPNCSKEFPTPKRNPTTKYCTHACSVEHMLSGKPKSEAHRANIKKNHARFWKGKKLTGERYETTIRTLKAIQKSGAEHWNWKGGITPKLKSFRFQSWYKDWRTAVFQRDGYTCQECGVVGNRLCVHHKTRFAELVHKNDLINLKDVNNGVTLCLSCHIKTDSYAKRFKKSI